MKHKYGAKRTQVDGIMFDSKAEASYYSKLVLLKRMGEITHIELQPKYLIVEGYSHPVTGKKVRPSYYVADFLVTYSDGRTEVIDVKSKPTMTPLYKLKKKLVEDKYKFGIIEVS